MHIKSILLLSVLLLTLNCQPLPDLDFNINQLVGKWVLGGADGFGYPHYTFCASAEFFGLNTTAGSINYKQTAYFAPDEGDLSKWGWWNQTGTLYYDTGKNYHLFLDANLALPYYQVTGFGKDYIEIVTPFMPGGSVYNSFKYMTNNSTSGDDPQALGCLSNISVAQVLNQTALVTNWYVLAMYAPPNIFSTATCVQWSINGEFAYMEVYNLELSYTSNEDKEFVSNWTVPMVFDITNYGRWFAYSVGPLYLNYYNPSGFGVLVPGIENIAYFISNTRGQITPAQMQIFQNQVNSLEMFGCQGNCQMKTLTGCTASNDDL